MLLSLHFFYVYDFLPSLYKCIRVSVGVYECKCVSVNVCMKGDLNSRKKR